VPVGPAKFDVNRCNESPLRGEKPDFVLSKFNTDSLPLRGILPVTRHFTLLGLTKLKYQPNDNTIYVQSSVS